MKKILLTGLYVLLFCFGYTQTETSSPYTFDTEALLSRVETLSSDQYAGRETGTEGSILSQALIIEGFKQWGAEPLLKKYNQCFKFKRSGDKLIGENIVAKIKGTAQPEHYIVVSAHYDHLGIHDGEIHNGADDNASGTSALISFAEHLSKHPPNHSVILVAFDAEEKGLTGAKHFVKEFENLSIVANLNMDMISRSAKNELYVVGSRYTEGLQTIIDSFENPTDTELLVGHDGSDDKQDWTNSSDHAPFHKKNIPFLYFGNEDHGYGIKNVFLNPGFTPMQGSDIALIELEKSNQDCSLNAICTASLAPPSNEIPSSFLISNDSSNSKDISSDFVPPDAEVYVPAK